MQTWALPEISTFRTFSEGKVPKMTENDDFRAFWKLSVMSWLPSPTNRRGQARICWFYNRTAIFSRATDFAMCLVAWESLQRQDRGTFFSSRPLGTDVWRRYCSIGIKSCIFCFGAMNEMLCDGQTPMLAALDNSSVVFGVYRHHISREINHTEVLRKCDRFGELPNSDLEGTQAMPRPCFILISAYFLLIQRA